LNNYTNESLSHEDLEEDYVTPKNGLNETRVKVIIEDEDSSYHRPANYQMSHS
jgi:hypothetical protein